MYAGELINELIEQVDKAVRKRNLFVNVSTAEHADLADVRDSASERISDPEPHQRSLRG
jgi:hypothetical protein